MKPLEELTRPNIWSLAPYSSARNEYAGREAHVFLDANENPYNAPYNRYPDPLQLELKDALSKVKGVPAENIFLGNGSDEPIDLVYRCFCNPKVDNVVAIDPTYGMYKVCADINDVEYRPVLLDEHFQVTADKILAATDAHTKLIWICSPNNPTGNTIVREEIAKVIESFEGLVIVDEAYSDFSAQKPFRILALPERHHRLCPGALPLHEGERRPGADRDCPLYAQQARFGRRVSTQRRRYCQDV